VKGDAADGDMAKGVEKEVGLVQDSNPGCWISSKDWNNMPDDKKEMIRKAQANYAKRNIGAVSTGNGDDAGQEEKTNNQGSPPKRQHLDTGNAGDHMSHSSRNYISQVRSSRRYATVQRVISLTRQNSNEFIKAKAELDSNADTMVAGSSCRVIEYTDKSCEVFFFLINTHLWRRFQLLRWEQLMTTLKLGRLIYLYLARLFIWEIS